MQRRKLCCKSMDLKPNRNVVEDCTGRILDTCCLPDARNGLWVLTTASCVKGLEAELVMMASPSVRLAEDVVESIARMQPERVVYVSCDSATMARDVKRFAALGYRAVRACAVDLFPRADHVEAVALLKRREDDQGPDN